jgi:hypothetical protein
MRTTMSDSSRRKLLGLIPTAAAIPLLGQTQGSGYRIHNISEYGAKGDGQTLDTAAVQLAIDAAHGDRGGVVLVPAGDFLVGNAGVEEQRHAAPLGIGAAVRQRQAGRLLGGKGRAAGEWQRGAAVCLGGGERHHRGSGDDRRSGPVVLHGQRRQHRPGRQRGRGLPGAAAPGDLLPLPQCAGASARGRGSRTCRSAIW